MTVDRSTLLQAANQAGDVTPVIDAFHRAFLVAALVAGAAAAIATRMPSRSLWKAAG